MFEAMYFVKWNLPKYIETIIFFTKDGEISIESFAGKMGEDIFVCETGNKGDGCQRIFSPQ